MTNQRAVCCLLAMVLTACAEPFEASRLYEREQSDLQSSYQDLTQWSEIIVTLIAEQEKTLDSALLMMEKQSTADEQKLEQLILKAQTQKDRITQYFFEGQKMQATLFYNIYQFVGKVNAGSSFCGQAASFEQIKLPELLDPTILPELKEAYASSHDKGMNMLSTHRDFPCEEFLQTHPSLLEDVETKIDNINRLMSSLAA